MKIIDDYSGIEFHNDLEMRVFVDVFFNDYEIREKFINKRNYYKYISGQDWYNYHMSEIIKGNPNGTLRTIYMGQNRDKMLIKTENEIIKRTRKEKLEKLYNYENNR